MGKGLRWKFQRDWSHNVGGLDLIVRVGKNGLDQPVRGDETDPGVVVGGEVIVVGDPRLRDLFERLPNWLRVESPTGDPITHKAAKKGRK